MKEQVITRQEIEKLYKKIGVHSEYETPVSKINLGTMDNKLIHDFKEPHLLAGNRGFNEKG